jgi:hypothetical protein
MTVETELFTRLTTYPGLNALVGTRVYPNKLPQDPTLPALSYRRVSAVRPSAMGSDIGLARARFQVDVWAATYASARAVAEQLRQALQRWRTTTGTIVQDSFVLNETDLYEDTTEIHHVAMDFEINYEE